MSIAENIRPTFDCDHSRGDMLLLLTVTPAGDIIMLLLDLSLTVSIEEVICYCKTNL